MSLASVHPGARFTVSAIVVLGAVVLACLQTAQSHAEAPRTSADPQVQAMVQVVDAFIEAFARGDTAAIEPLFWDDAIVYPSNDRDRVGWADISGYWAPPFETVNIELRVDLLGVLYSGDLAVMEMITCARVTPKDGSAEPAYPNYRDMVVLRRDESGRWRILRNLSQAYPRQAPPPACAFGVAS